MRKEGKGIMFVSKADALFLGALLSPYLLFMYSNEYPILNQRYSQSDGDSIEEIIVERRITDINHKAFNNSQFGAEDLLSLLEERPELYSNSSKLRMTLELAGVSKSEDTVLWFERYGNAKIEITVGGLLQRAQDAECHMPMKKFSEAIKSENLGSKESTR